MARTSLASLGRLAAIAATFVVSGLAASAFAAVEVEITEIRGAAAVKKKGTDDWVELKKGDVLHEGDVVRLPGNFTEVSWKRVDAGGCGNEGSVGTGMSKVKEVEVGREIRSAAPPATYFHSVSDGQQQAGEVTIIESGQCVETDHCGASSDLAAAAAIDPTPDGMTTVIALENVLDAGGMAIETTIGNSPRSPIPIFTCALHGSMSDQLLPIYPGQAVQWVRTDNGDVIPLIVDFKWVFCGADFNDDGAVDTRDALEFFNAWNSRTPGADFNGDGNIDTRDVIEFLNAWTAGCR
ncbi:MAG TPA: GC-type dockerin domain-anchored protein [Phycisphaerales bacterium]|nr:GC-type dockerin domain-anchored protein [Phycisphaerales bacterium]